jgi:hypothetical protein
MDLELLEMKATRFIEMSRTAYPVTQRYIPENRNPLLLVLDYLFYARFFNTPCQFTPLDLHSLTFGFTPFAWLHPITLT